MLPKLIETLMQLTVEHAGAERDPLILLREDKPLIEAEAITSHERAAVTVWRTAVTPSLVSPICTSLRHSDSGACVA